MADLRYTAEIDTSSAQRSLSNLQGTILGLSTAIAGAFTFKELTTVSKTFEDLRVSLQILYKDVFTGSKAFEEIKKIAETSSFSVQDLTETVIKLKAAGLTPTVELLKLFGNVSSVAADKVGALQAITDLYARTTAGGLGLEELNRLQDRGIAVFDIIEKKLGVSRLAVAELGKTAEGSKLILKALEVGLNETYGGASAARANTLSQATSNLGDAFSNIADTMGQGGLNAGLRDLVKAFTDLLVSMKPLAYAVGVALGDVFKFIAENIRIVTAAAVGLFAVMSVAAIVRIAQAFLLLNTVLVKNPIIAAIGAIAGIMSVAAVNSGDLSDKMKELSDAMDAANGKDNVIANGKLADETEVSKQKALALNEAFQKFRVEIRAVGDEFAKNNAHMIDAINLENSFIGKSKEYIDAEKAREEIYRKSADEIEKLRLQKEKLTTEEKNQGRGGVIDAQIERIKQLAEVDANRVAKATENANRLQAIEQARQFGLSNEFDLQKKLSDLQFEVATSTLPTLEKKYAEIAKAADDAAKAAIRAEEQRLGRKLDVNEQKRYYDEARKGNEQLKKATEEQYEQSRRFSTGWSQAFNEYIDNATNAAQNAKDIFGKITSSMENTFVNFAKTGKFAFKDMINSIIEDLLRMQIKATLAKVMGLGGNSGGSGGLFGGKIIPGILASGGPVSNTRPYIVGERGPELFLPSSNGQMFPNSALGGGGSVVYNIQAVDAPSFQALVARDPSFIHAVAMAGARAYPTTRR